MKPPIEKLQDNKQAYRQIAAVIKPWEYLDYKQYLGDLFSHLKREFKEYSYVQFTIDMGFGQCNAMYLIVHGNRPLTSKGARKIVDALDLRKVARQYFLALVEYTNAADPTTRDESLQELLRLKGQALPTKLDRQQLDFLSEWYNVAILEILKIPGARCEPSWLSDHLLPRVSLSKVERSLELLVALGLVKRGRYGSFRIANDIISTGPEIAGMGAINFHHQMLELARDSIAKIDPTKRDISSLTFSTDTKTRDLIKQEIVAFRKRLIELVASGANESENLPPNATEVVQVNFQMFPLCKPFKSVE